MLIVEDEASIRRLASANLVARGYDVIAVESGEEGLQRMQQRLPRSSYSTSSCPACRDGSSSVPAPPTA